jgi:hypothetical protein
MLIGGPLEAFDLPFCRPFVGTEMMGAVWVTHRTGEAVHMLSGFFRGPDVMGWHAALLFMVAVVLALRSKGPARWLWIAVAIWGILIIWLCGRRKMLSMIPISWAGYALLVFRFKNVQRILSICGMAAMIVGLGWYLISSMVHNEALERFYSARSPTWRGASRPTGSAPSSPRSTRPDSGATASACPSRGSTTPRTWRRRGSGRKAVPPRSSRRSACRATFSI